MANAKRFFLGAAILLALLLGWRAFFYHAPHRTASAPAVSAPSLTSIPQPNSREDLILELFNPSDASLQGQQQEATLVRNIEEAMIASFILRKCGSLSESEYTDTYRALLAYITATHLATDPAAELQRISASASASYSLLYAATACDSPALAQAAQSLASWRKSMLAP